MIRAFIALNIPEDIKTLLEKAISELKKRNRNVRWVKPQGMHVTLKFLGDIPEDAVITLSLQLDNACQHFGQPALNLSGFGAFPNPRRARVIWAGLGGDIDELIRLASSIDNLCADFGIAQEKRPFSGHITLGRLKSSTVVNLDIGPVTGMFSALEVFLYQSILLPSGAQYTVLHRSPLGII